VAIARCTRPRTAARRAEGRPCEAVAPALDDPPAEALELPAQDAVVGAPEVTSVIAQAVCQAVGFHP
jgi:hypothetical protein